ncbi:MAG: polysaccharide biosynthesis protein [Bifidobacteriaceae bacterium]|jgi:dTDP-glucose 4,6-dehydratase|nr:polysaccharide biosynthesis protein [Bifidobacteriaceae bacterium]
MLRLLRRHRTAGLILWDVLCWVAALGWLILMRYDLAMPTKEWAGTLIYLAAAVCCQVIGGLGTQVYLGRGRVGSFTDVSWLGMTVAGIGVVLLAVADLLRLGTPRGILLGLPALALIMMLAGRCAWRSFSDFRRRRSDDGRGIPALVYGAGEIGHQIARQIGATGDAKYSIVGFVDDDLSKRFRRVESSRVLGTGADLVALAQKHGARVVVVAIARATPTFLARVSDECKRAGLALSVVPPFAELIGGRFRLDQIRSLEVTDLLGRRPVATDLTAIAGYINGRVVLITGAGGSIGSELARQVHRLVPTRVVLLDRDESALHAVALTISGSGLLHRDDTVLCDIRDYEALSAVFQREKPDVVFHAAALKHLPLLERFPDEGWKTNVLGTWNALRCAAEAGVGRFVNISTDKAADPTSVLGLTKRVAERITAWYAKDLAAPYVSVRFGNVLGSRGSVLDTFRYQIARGGPLMVTHPEVTRYFMTIPEACELVLQAGAGGNPGDALVLDMGEPVKIVDVARQMIAQSGRDIGIEFTGLRPGEKLHEALFSVDEAGQPGHHPLVRRVAVPPLDPLEAAQGGIARWRGEESQARPNSAAGDVGEESASSRPRKPKAPAVTSGGGAPARITVTAVADL